MACLKGFEPLTFWFVAKENCSSVRENTLFYWVFAVHDTHYHENKVAQKLHCCLIL